MSKRFPKARGIIVAFQFPPINAGGTMRSVRFANQFAELGIDIQVVCAEASSLGQANVDPSLLTLVDSRVSVHRVPMSPARNGLLGGLVRSGYTFQPDEFGLRLLAGFEEKLKELLSGASVDFVMVSMPPFGLHPLLSKIRKLTDAVLVADMRDAWSQWIMTPYASYLHYLASVRNERRLIQDSDLVAVTSRVTSRDLKRIHAVSHSKMVYSPNSFNEYTSPRFSQIDPDKGTIEVLYVGSFYYEPRSQSLFSRPWYRKRPYQWLQYAPRLEDWSYRGPQRLLQIFDELMKREPIFETRLRLTFAGKKPQWWESVLISERLKKTCRHIGFVSKKEVSRLVSNSDALMVTSSKVVDGYDYSIAGKTFEYFAARKPIIGAVTRSAQRDLLDASGVALCLDPDAPQESAVELSSLLKGKLKLAPNQSFLDSHLSERVSADLLKRIFEARDRCSSSH